MISQGVFKLLEASHISEVIRTNHVKLYFIMHHKSTIVIIVPGVYISHGVHLDQIEQLLDEPDRLRRDLIFKLDGFLLELNKLRRFVHVLIRVSERSENLKVTHCELNRWLRLWLRIESSPDYLLISTYLFIKRSLFIKIIVFSIQLCV